MTGPEHIGQTPTNPPKSPWSGPPVAPHFLPTDEPWADYYRVQFPGHTRPSAPMSAFKYATTAKNISRALWDARERARAEWEARVLVVRPTLPLHAPVVLWLPSVAHPACLGCTWLSPGVYSDLVEAADKALRHAVESDGSYEQPVHGRIPLSEEGGRCINPSGRRWVRVGAHDGPDGEIDQ